MGLSTRRGRPAGQEQHTALLIEHDENTPENNNNLFFHTAIYGS
jgi:hypothetical protein